MLLMMGLEKWPLAIEEMTQQLVKAKKMELLGPQQLQTMELMGQAVKKKKKKKMMMMMMT